jgi:hypothetical protein
MERPRNWNFWLCVFSFFASRCLDEAKSERSKLALSTVIKLIFEGFAGMAYLTVFHSSGAASD